MAKKYLDENGLAYFWSKLKQYLATPTRAGLMSPTDKAKVDAITNQGTIAYYRKIEGSYTTVSTGEDTIPIPITNYSTADILLVDVNGLDLVEGVDYTISGTNIVLATPISVAGQAVHFIALRATTATSADYSTLKGDDGDVSDVLVDGNSVVNQQGVANISVRSLGLIDVFYPVGSYYETSDTTFDPNTAWGGTWVKDSAGMVTVAQDTEDTAFDTVGDTGGSKDIQAHTHGFTAPSYTTGGAGSHNHVPATANRVFVTTSDNVASGNFTRHSVKPGSGTAVTNLLSSKTVVGWGTVTNTVANHSHTVNHTSGTGSVNAVSGASTGNAGNLQPYIVVNRWHRTA